jgi:hypothetical protein
MALAARLLPAYGARSWLVLAAIFSRIGHSDVAFTMKQYVQTDLAADRRVANTLAELIIGRSLASIDIGSAAAAGTHARAYDRPARQDSSEDPAA